jgi:ATP-dependent Clp protease ATP-binding subunit ClpC
MSLFSRIFSRSPRPIDNVTPRAQRLLVHARRSADRYSHSSVGREHLLLGLLDVDDGIGFATLKNLGVDPMKIRKSAEAEIDHGQQLRIEPKIAAREDLMSTLRIAAAEAEALSHSYLGTEHVLLALLQTQDGIAARALRSAAIDLAATREMVIRTLAATPSK